MMILHPYISECDAWQQTPHEYRWIYNKLELHERLGNLGECGPIGAWMPRGQYCVRPIINVSGMAKGGFKKVVVEQDRDILHEPSGYCWTPWLFGKRRWDLYVDDECIFSQYCWKIEDDIEHYIETSSKKLHPELRGISRYMIVESIGGTVIDVGPRHMVEEMRLDVVEDYQKIDRNYVPPAYGTFGIQPFMRIVKDGEWTRHEEVRHWDDRLTG